MKKLVMFLGVLALMVVFSASQTGAALLGMKSYVNFRPNIFFDILGYIEYNYNSSTGTGFFEIKNTFDRWITFADNTQVYLTIPNDLFTGFGLAIYVDKSGNLTKGVSKHTYSWSYDIDNDGKIENDEQWSYGPTDYDMVEVLLKGSVTIAGHTYTAPALLLAGEVRSFGWGEPSSPGAGDAADFDFIFENLSGALVDDGIWPSEPPHTGALVETGYWSGDWTKNATITTIEGKKMPTPEPGTLMLLGSGLLGFGAFFRARFGRKKKD